MLADDDQVALDSATRALTGAGFKVVRAADGHRALQEAPSTQTVAMASAKPAAESPGQAATNDSSTLDKTSLIGKIFIAFGALLTMASAARMLMA